VSDGISKRKDNRHDVEKFLSIHAQPDGDLEAQSPSGKQPTISDQKGANTTTKSSTDQTMNLKETGCESLLQNPEYAQEWSRRAAQWSVNFSRGGEIRRQQLQRTQLGRELKKVRWCLGLSREEVAQAINLEPLMLCFLESGWATNEEFHEVIDPWVTKLGLDIDEYRQRIPLPIEST
jgi:hypothetical protein